MRLFQYLLKSSPGTFALAIAAGVVSGGTGAAFIAIVNLALKRSSDTRLGLLWVYIALCLATVTTRILAQVLLYRLSQGVIYDLRRRLVDGILGAPLRGVEQTGTAKLYSALTDDVVVIGNALPGLPAISSSAAFVVVAIVYLATVSPVVALSTVITTAIGVTFYRLFAVYGLRNMTAAREDQDRLFEHFRAVTEGLKELKLNRRRRQVLAGDQLNGVAESYRRRSVLGLSIFEGAAGSGQATIFAFIGVVLFVLAVTFAISQQTLAACVLVLLFTVASIQGVLVWLPVLGRATVALGKIEERLAFLESQEPDNLPDADRGFQDWQRIQFRDVSHVYPGPAGEVFVLGPLDVEFRRGEVLFVVGGNGSGKTTLAKVVTGLYLPEGGSVWVDDTQVTADNRETYRQLFSAVFTDFFVFDSLLGLPPEDRAAKAQHYLARLQLDHKVSIVGDSFSTTSLSQGQRKRLALLAAYLEDRSFYVFDEWAADQDPLFKQFFYEELLAELKARGKAVMVISHDDRYFHVADRLIRLDYGQIRQEGILSGQTVAGPPAGQP
jgi:putative ATP-binding cassette transporter